MKTLRNFAILTLVMLVASVSLSAQTFSTNQNNVTATHLGNGNFKMRWPGAPAEGFDAYLAPIDQAWKSHTSFTVLFSSPVATRNGGVTWYVELAPNRSTGFVGGPHIIREDGRAYPLNEKSQVYANGVCLNGGGHRGGNGVVFAFLDLIVSIGGIIAAISAR